MANLSGNYVEDHRLIDETYSLIMRSLRKKKYPDLLAMVGRRVKFVIRRDAPKPDYRIIAVEGVLSPFSPSNSPEHDFGLCLKAVKYHLLENRSHNLPDEYDLQIDSVESFEEVTQEVAESAASG